MHHLCAKNLGHALKKFLDCRSLMQIVHASSRIATENAQIANIWTKIPGKKWDRKFTGSFTT